MGLTLQACRLEESKEKYWFNEQGEMVLHKVLQACKESCKESF
jgi:hypothetical protein